MIFSAIWGLISNKYVAGGLAIVTLALGFWTVAWSYGRASVDVPSIQRVAYDKGYKQGQTDRDAEWQKKLALANEAAQAQISHWQTLAEEAETANPTPTTAPELIALCAKDALCEK